MAARVRAPDRAPTSACAVAVDVALLTVTEGRLQLLLVEPDDPALHGSLALPGRRVRDDEDLDATAHRALAELAGLRAPDAHLEQLRTYGAIARDPRARVVSVVYLALTPTTDARLGTRARLIDVAELDGPRPPRLAYDHDAVIPDAIERARAKLEYTPLATAFVSEPFTLAELRGIYEAVWGVALDDANFRRKVRSVEDFVVPTGERSRPGPGGGRPAQSYRRGTAARLHPAMLRP
ncbi:MAG: NUDIX hydrolase [Nitriliruptoraceae bacterium]|nr:NUDIX hydrolase [Nitriliruptoraceae bacterium]